jgi:hypothetical protein
MRKFFFIILFLLAGLFSYSQELNQVIYTRDGSFSSFSFLTDQGVHIRISDDGKIIEWGIETQSLRYNLYAPKLQPFMGRIDYYGAESPDSASRGKIKSIGTCVLTYYGRYETAEKTGKIKSIGMAALDYYTNYDNTNLKGKLKFAGRIALDYYSSFENEAFRGKLKSVGNNTPITYYSSFDDKLIRGRIKSIGTIAYTWYTSLDRKEYAGGLKTGSYRQLINGVTYILQ